MTALCLLCRSQNERARACPRQSRPCRLLLHVFRQFHRLHSEWGQMTNATAINAVPVLEDVYAGTTQEWSLRLDLFRHTLRIYRLTALS